MTVRTEDGETATATLYEIVHFNNSAANGGGKGIVTAVFQTNSTGTLAPLNGLIAAGIDDMMLSGASHVTLWKWESGISSDNNDNDNNSTGINAPSTVQGESPMNTTTTNPTTTDTNATAPDEQAGEEEETATTIPAPLLE